MLRVSNGWNHGRCEIMNHHKWQRCPRESSLSSFVSNHTTGQQVLMTRHRISCSGRPHSSGHPCPCKPEVICAPSHHNQRNVVARPSETVVRLYCEDIEGLIIVRDQRRELQQWMLKETNQDMCCLWYVWHNMIMRQISISKMKYDDESLDGMVLEDHKSC